MIDLNDKQTSGSKYERLRDFLVQQIRQGDLKPGQALPAEMQLVKSLGIARTTVRQAMALMENQGLIRRVQGKGTFVDDAALRKLRRGMDIFALVVPETRGAFFPSLLHAFETAAGEVQHQTLICSTDENVDRQASIILQLLDKEVGGVAILPTGLVPTPQCHVRELHKQNIPVVFCFRRVEGIAAPLLAIPYVDVGRLAGRALVERGHRRIAFLVTERTSVAEKYEAGLREVMTAAGCNSPLLVRYINEFAAPDQEKAILAMLHRTFGGPDRPTAIFTSFDTLAETIYMLLPRLGLRVPEDVSLMGFGGIWRTGAVAKRLASVTLDEIATGRQAVTLLHQMRNGERAIDDNTEIVLELSIYEGETLGRPAARIPRPAKKTRARRSES